MKEESKWPLYSYVASIVGAATIGILKLYAAQRGGSHFSSGGVAPIFLALTPFLFAALVINFSDGPRALKYLSLAIILQTAAAIFGYYQAIFLDTGFEGSLDLGLVPLYQFAFLGVAATLVRFIKEPTSRGHQNK